MRPTRCSALPLRLLALLVALLPLLSGAAAQPPRAARPNVLFIAIDDLNDWVSPLGGYPGVRTPNFERLTRRGVLFTRAYCAAPACNPSRTAILTGRMPASTGVYHNNQPWRPVLRDVVTLPQHFRAAGYRVVGGGKIFHGGFNDPASWETYQRTPASPLPDGRPLNGIPRAGHFDWGPLDTSDEAMGDWKVTEWAAAFLAQKQDRPFFLAVGLTKPHLPWYVPRKYFDLYPLSSIRLPRVRPDDLDDVPPIGRRMANPDGDHRRVTETGNWEKAVQGYLAAISFADSCLGKLLDALERSEYARNTIVVAWGDHGWHLGQKQHWRKFALWEEATRVPLVIAAPGTAREGGRCARTVNLADLYPTLIDLCSLPPREGLEGRSLAPLLRRPDAAWDRPSLTTHGRGNHAVRSERYRYIRYSDGTEELYDHESDPLEWTNLADRPEMRPVKERLAAWLPKANAPDAPRVRGAGDE